MKKKICYFLILFMAIPSAAYAMHIAEGYLPLQWCGFYYILCAPFIYKGIKRVKKLSGKNKDIKMLIGLVAAYCFVLSALKLPSVTGSTSHPTGTGFGAIVFGPTVMAVIGLIVLLFQAIFLAHGGITTLGANTLSMAIVGPIVSYGIYKLLKNKNKNLAIFLGAALGDLATYCVTALELALAFPNRNGGVLFSFLKFIGIFGITQVPLAIVEGLLTIVIFKFIEKNSIEELNNLKENF